MKSVSGALGGKSGSFVLMHTGVMDRGQPSLAVTVVPDSGTGELIGLTGKMAIALKGRGAFPLPSAPDSAGKRDWATTARPIRPAPLMGRFLAKQVTQLPRIASRASAGRLQRNAPPRG